MVDGTFRARTQIPVSRLALNLPGIAMTNDKNDSYFSHWASLHHLLEGELGVWLGFSLLTLSLSYFDPSNDT